ncbi:MAG: DJ-1/PfpI family protein [Armatimonadetes bacterium]|nr:DJ-1/PfpI family protein [Armatimonadota bacterium]
MKQLFCISGFALAALPFIGGTAAPKPLVLKGLDPVALLSGKQVQGDAKLFAESGNFRYLFANESDKTEFLTNTSKYAVQNGGKCAMMPEMNGQPDLFAVIDGKIFLAGSASCLTYLLAEHSKEVKQSTDLHRKKVAILIFPGVQIIDYTGPFEVLGQAGYDVFTVAAKPDALTTGFGMKVTPNYTFENCPQPDLIVLPGGNVPRIADAGDPQVAWVKSMVPKTEHVMSVCNGAFWLANAGALDGKNATTFYNLLDELKGDFPKVNVVWDKKFVDNGQIICTAGLSSGIEGALHMIEVLEGPGVAKSVAMNMEYNWLPDSGYARGNFGDKYLRRLARRGFQLPDPTKVKTVDVKGAPDAFFKEWALTDCPASATELMESVKKTLSAGWQLANSESDGVEKTTWKFKGDDGASWTAEVLVRADQQVKGKFTMSITMRNDTASRK